jgi:signal transduction histidine kinase
MKVKYLTWLSALALIILVVAQYFFITETFETKKAQIDSKYSGLIKNGLYEFEDQYYAYSMDSLFNSMDNHAFNYLFADSGFDSLISDFDSLLNSYEDLDLFLKVYIKKSGEDPLFHSVFTIRSLTLIGLNENNVIYLDTTIAAPRAYRDPILAGAMGVEKNYFRMNYDYYISIDHKTGMVMREMRLTLFLALFSILIVFVVYYLTLRNMLLQKRLSDLKTDFINNMTHELKTPLSTISVASSSLINPDMTINEERIKQLSSLIKKQNKHLSDLIDRILDISIWEKDQVRIRKKEVRIESFITDIVEAFRLEYGKNDLDIAVEMSIENEFVLIDEIHMTTVLNNLLMNAKKYCLDKPRVELEVKSNAQLQVVLSDNGPGINPEEQKHLFEKFYRGQDSKSRAIRGLGLGLYYVKQIVEAHGGKIRLFSEVGNGATFEINIPMNYEHTAG